jgi:hypothetical protein
MAKKPSVMAAKRAIKFLAICHNPNVYKPVLRAAPDNVIRVISNAAYNVEQGDIALTPEQKRLFAKYRKQIAKLTSPTVSLANKRKALLSQRGGFLLPALLGAALGTLGASKLMNAGN